MGLARHDSILTGAAGHDIEPQFSHDCIRGDQGISGIVYVCVLFSPYLHELPPSLHTYIIIMYVCGLQIKQNPKVPEFAQSVFFHLFSYFSTCWIFYFTFYRFVTNPKILLIHFSQQLRSYFHMPSFP